MRLGEVEIKVANDGTFRHDAGSMFGIVPKVLWARQIKTDRKNRITLGLNCFLIQTGKSNILVDTGVGTKHTRSRKTRYAMAAGHLVSSLGFLGLSPEEIHWVVLTHLHFDHAGGCTHVDRNLKTVPTFPKAQYLVQRQDWEEATHPNERTRAGYFPEDFLPLQETKQLELVQGDVEVTPRVRVRRMGGHTAGHQVVLVESQGQHAASLGDLLPTASHLPLPYATAWDLYPLEGLNGKREVLSQAEKEGWLLLLGHGNPSQAGYLQRQGDRLELRPVEL